LSFLEKFLAIDRRYIFIVVGVAVIIPFLMPLKLGVTESPPVKHVYDFIEAIPEGTDKPVLVSFDYDPSTQPELSPMAVAILTHCFRRDIPVIVTSLHPGGPGLALDVSATVSEDMGKKYGEDYVFLGYKAGSSAVMLAMGEDIRLTTTTYTWSSLYRVPRSPKRGSCSPTNVTASLSHPGLRRLWPPTTTRFCRRGRWSVYWAV
jgi:hypothetical protein